MAFRLSLCVETSIYAVPILGGNPELSQVEISGWTPPTDLQNDKFAKILVEAAAVLLFFVLWKFNGKAAARVLAGAATSGLILLGPAAVGLSQLLVYTPAILDAQGPPLAASIAAMEKISQRAALIAARCDI